MLQAAEILMSKQRPRHADIHTALRARIFASDPEKTLILRETDIAKEFGVSRTPIRQVLQALAYEQLVRTQTGVGTVPTVLDPKHRERDFLAYSQLALAAVNLPGNKITNEIKMRVLGLYHMLQSSENRTLDLFVSLAQESGEATCQVISEPIISDALAAARWRVVRWRIVDLRTDPDAFWAQTLTNFERSSTAVMTGKPDQYLKAIAQVVQGMSK